MISRIYVDRDWAKYLIKYDDIYTIESEEVSGLIYGISDYKFAMFYDDGIAFCPLFAVQDELIPKVIPQIKNEIKMICDEYEHIAKIRSFERR